MKENVLQLIGSFHQGGSERQAVQLCRLLKDDATYRVFAGTLDSEGSLRNEIDELDLGEIPEFKLNSFYDANFFRQVNSCASFIKENKIQIVQTHDFYTNIFGMAAAFYARVPVRIAAKRETLSKTNKQMLFERQAFRLAHKVLTNADAVKEFLVKSGVPEKKLVTIHNGLDLDRLKPSPDQNREQILREFGLPTAVDFQFVTIVANLRSDVKNHEMFLRAAKTTAEQVENVGFVMVGEGELIDSLKKFSSDLGIGERTHFTGRCSKIAEVLSISNVCVLSSRSEGFSNSILEYMAASKPVVATNVGGASEAVIDGETGFLVDSDDDAAMADRLVELLLNDEKAKRFGENGRKYVEENFSLAAQTEKTLKLYESLLNVVK